MASAVPRSYDREYTKTRSQHSRIRVTFSTERGEVTRFVLQPEYRIGNDWRQVVRFDHDRGAEWHGIEGDR